MPSQMLPPRILGCRRCVTDIRKAWETAKYQLPVYLPLMPFWVSWTFQNFTKVVAYPALTSTTLFWDSRTALAFTTYKPYRTIDAMNASSPTLCHAHSFDNSTIPRPKAGRIYMSADGLLNMERITLCSKLRARNTSSYPSATPLIVTFTFRIPQRLSRCVHHSPPASS